MGNRAVVTFDSKPTLNSVGVYLHWNGSPKSIRAFADALDEFQVRDGEADPSYQLARFVQIIGNYFGGTLSLGVGLLKHLDRDNGDNGVYAIERTAGKCVIRQSASGNLHGPWVTLEVPKDEENVKVICKAQGDRFSANASR